MKGFAHRNCIGSAGIQTVGEGVARRAVRGMMMADGWREAEFSGSDG